MLSFVRSNVFEVSVTKEEYEKINEPRLTKDFLAECLIVSEKLRK